MCQFQALYHNDKIGYAVRCTECEKIQVAYGNLVMTFSREDFSSFRYWIRRIRDEQPGNSNPMIRSILIPAPCQGIQLLLSKSELVEFSSLLESADTEMQALQLINMFNPNTFL